MSGDSKTSQDSVLTLLLSTFQLAVSDAEVQAERQGREVGRILKLKWILLKIV